MRGLCRYIVVGTGGTSPSKHLVGTGIGGLHWKANVVVWNLAK